jgi:MEMO1 family protein
MSGNIREPAVAGLFYPAGADACRRSVQAWLSATALDRTVTAQPGALIVPHAGYIYSGGVAAAAYRLLDNPAARIRRVVLIGPNHRVPLRGIAVPSCDAFRTPLGTIALDSERRAQIAAMPGVTIDDRAHRDEHSLEVHLPFLQCVLGEFRLLPLLVGECDPAAVARVLDALWSDNETLLLVSSDLSHFASYAHAREHDEATARRIEACQTTLHPEDACGARALNGFLRLAGERGLRATRLALLNSGDTAGSRDRVVGYGSWRLD